MSKTCKRLKFPFNINDPDRLLDLVVMSSYVKGNMSLDIPVDESREVFEKIKCLVARKALSETSQ